MRVLTAAEMASIDRRATERFGIPSIVLMENAALAVVDAIFTHYPDCDRAAVFCGPGRNGGDGLAVARHLENRGVVPVIIVAGDRSRYDGDALTNFTTCERLGIPMYDIRASGDVEEALVHAADADIVVDAIFGTGLNRAPEGLFADVIRGIAELRLPVVAVDLPSGANASSSIPFDPCLQAEVTVTFAAPKMCHVFQPAAIHCGEVIVADISIPQRAIEEENVALSLITIRDVQPLVAPRLAETHKGTYGHVGVIAGSPGRSGAAVLAARGAIRGGAGLVTVMTDAETARLVHAASLESMTVASDDIAGFLKNKDAIVIGPGLAADRQLIDSIELPLVIDASALDGFAGKPQEINPRGLPRIITPHPGELARLLGRDTAAINGDRIAAARETARLCNCVVVLKGHQTLIAEPDGHVYVNPTGNPGMASGGMGDVLGGLIASFLARGVDALDAACAAV
ncbi:MAG TPA: NAD(P)H-hydrate dehydratase, partial [Thermoanaerobaculia bacterium]|nr:NAD(P)H-hydrate dehydratase [Thermoanaerobaculia bacterium]